MRTKVLDLTILEYTYDTKEERDKHVAEMKSMGYENDGCSRRLKKECSIWDAKYEDSYEWFATFQLRCNF